MIRKPIVAFMGHVDTGKTSIQDFIRQSTMTEREAGMITQHIGCSSVPIDTIKRICGDMLKSLKMGLTIPGFLMIDSPGHAAFTNLRKRGGNLADIAVVVIDIKEGFKPQTIEVIEILKAYKTPFVVAANKTDLIPGWKPGKGSILSIIKEQSEQTQQLVDKKIYELVGKLHEHGFQSERFDRVEDYTKQVAIVPTSAKTGEGIPALLMVLSGLCERFLESCLECDICSPAKGTVLEVKEEKGLGKIIDVIIYDGCLKTNDTIVIGGIGEPIVTRVKAMFEPAPLSEIRDKKSKFKSVREVSAAIGVRICAPEIDNVIAGMPIRMASKETIDKVKQEIQKDVEEVLVETDKDGIIIKADTLGSLEALMNMLKDKSIKVRKAMVGDILKKDISDAESSHEKNPFESVILGFNAADASGIRNDKVKVITHDVIYKLIEDYEKWIEEEKKRQEAKELENLARPCKIKLLRGYVFRQNNPAVVGVEVMNCTLKTGINLMKKDGHRLTSAKSMQLDKENVSSAEKGKQLAVSLPNVTVGRQIHEDDILYSVIPEKDFRRLKELKRLLKPEEIDLLKEIAEIMRKENPVWGV